GCRRSRTCTTTRPPGRSSPDEARPRASCGPTRAAAAKPWARCCPPCSPRPRPHSNETDEARSHARAAGPIPHGLRLAILERHDAIARALFEHHARPELALPVPIEIDGPAHLEHVALALRLRDEDEPVEIALRRQEQPAPAILLGDRRIRHEHRVDLVGLALAVEVDLRHLMRTELVAHGSTLGLHRRAQFGHLVAPELRRAGAR